MAQAFIVRVNDQPLDLRAGRDQYNRYVVVRLYHGDSWLADYPATRDNVARVRFAATMLSLVDATISSHVAFVATDARPECWGEVAA